MLENYIEQLKRLVQEVAPEDKIMALFSQMQSDIVPKNHGVLHAAIFKLRQIPEYKELLDEFTFDTSGITPYSKSLEKVINRLETFSIFGTLNPSYDKYKVNKEYLLSSYKKFSTTDQDAIIGMGKELELLIS